MLGGLLATALAVKNVRGVVIDGRCRDLAELRASLPVRSFIVYLMKLPRPLMLTFESVITRSSPSPTRPSASSPSPAPAKSKSRSAGPTAPS